MLLKLRATRLPRLGQVDALTILLVTVAFLLATVALWIVMFGLLETPISYDEGYNLQVPRHLAEHGAYATDGSLWGTEPKFFDSFISTGPTVLMPVAVAFLLFGIHLWVARLVMVGFFLLLLMAAWCFCARAGGPRWGILGVAAVLVINGHSDWPLSDLLSPVTVLGEIPAGALTLWACLMLPRRIGWSGLLFGLAILAKLQMAIALPALLLGAFLSRSQAGLGRRCLDGLKHSCCIAVPVLMFQTYELVSLGVRGYEQHLREFLYFFVVHSGAGMNDRAAPDGVAHHLLALSHAWYGPGLALTVGAILTLGFFAVSRGGTHKTRSNEAKRLTSELPLLTAALAGLLIMSWWLFISERTWIRHAVPGLLILSVAVSAALCYFTRAGSVERRETRLGRNLLAAGGSVMLAWSLLAAAKAATDPPGISLADQRAAATFFRDRSQPLRHTGWSQNPELTFLAGIRSTDLRYGGGLAVIDSHSRMVSPQDSYHLQTLCQGRVRKIRGYFFCQARRDGDPSG